MRTPSSLSRSAVRAAAVLLIAVGSLNLALGVAGAIFLGRQGERAPARLPLAGWLVLVVAGLFLYARSERTGDRLQAAFARRPRST